MKTPEQEPILQKLEVMTSADQPSDIFDNALLEAEALRRQKLASVKDRISLKYFQEIERKLQREQQLAEDLLNIKKRRVQHLAKYSHILDTHYFEQQLLV